MRHTRSTDSCRITLVVATVLACATASSATVAAASTTYVVSRTVTAGQLTVGASTVLSGAVSPARPGARIYLLRYMSGAWHSVTSRTLDAHSHYAITITQKTAGSYVYRVGKPASAGVAGGRSAPVTLTWHALPWAQAWAPTASTGQPHLGLTAHTRGQQTCSGVVTRSPASLKLPTVVTTTQGYAHWSWTAPVNAPSGTWTLTLSCHPAGGVTKTFSTRAVVRPKSPSASGKLLVSGTMRTDPPPPPPAPPASATCLSNPSGCGFPDASNTGPTGTLTPSGSITISTPGAVVQNLDVKGCVTIDASNVTFKNSRVSGADCGGPLVNVPWSGVSGVVVDHVVLDGGRITGNTGIWGGNFTISSSEIFGTGDAIDVGDNVLVKGDYIHDLFVCSGCHVDGVQSTGTTNDRVTHSTIKAYNDNSAIIWGADQDSMRNVTADHNLFDGGGFTVYAGYDPGSGNTVTGVGFTDNRFGKGYDYGPCSFNDRPNITFTGNVYDSGGGSVSC